MLRKRIVLWLIWACYLLLIAAPAAGQSLEDYSNILEVRNLPKGTKDWSAFCFSDRGAWFGFALPDPQQPGSRGSFPGPFLMTHGRWLSPGLLKMQIREMKGGTLSKSGYEHRWKFHYFPGKLTQYYQAPFFSIKLELIFISQYSALIRGTVKNGGKPFREIDIAMTGELFEPFYFQEKDNELLIMSREQEGHAAREIAIIRTAGQWKISTGKDRRSYTLKTPAPGESLEFQVSFTQLLPGTKERDRQVVTAALQDPERFFAANKARWQGYLDAILKIKSPWSQEPLYREIAVKALLTLVNNWRGPNGDLLHSGLFPSYAVNYFNGFWGWDSWKHAVALAPFAPELAKDQVRAMLDYQDDRGFIADCIYSDKKENNWLNTKPPLAAWAVWTIFKSGEDKAFLKEITPGLLKFHQWWYAYRDHDQNGLCEYGASADKVIGAKWESGMDDGLRFDKGKMVRNKEKAWSINQESVDLNSYLYADKIYLSKILAALGQVKEAHTLYRQAEQLKKKIQASMFDPVTGFFYDISLEKKKHIKVMGPEGWIPLWAGVATKKQAARVHKVMSDPKKFACYIPLPTVPADHPAFMSGYWRGPVWLDQVYFGIRGLHRYGYEKTARTFTQQLFDRLEGLKGTPGPIRENYDPRNGKGLKVNHFSWSAAHLLLLYINQGSVKNIIKKQMINENQ